MGLYGERVGALSVITKSADVTKRVESQLKQVHSAICAHHSKHVFSSSCYEAPSCYIRHPLADSGCSSVCDSCALSQMGPYKTAKGT